MKKLAIIGASYLQAPLIERAKSMNIETHVFAWAANDVGEKIADFFYPISIVEKEQILEKCIEVRIDGICSIASDLAAITVNYVANRMGLVGNNEKCMQISTNKHLMRDTFLANGDPSPKSILVNGIQKINSINIEYPAIVKPIDRSGSRGITKITAKDELKQAIYNAMEQGFEKVALVEEYVEGQEYSVEYVSWKGQHHFLALTHKYTTGNPHFIETGHIEPAPVSKDILERIKQIVEHALDSLQIENGASHSELKVSEDGAIKIIEIGGRMGGDFIGSNLVELSTGIDFVRLVIDVAMGQEPLFDSHTKQRAAGVRFIFNEKDIEVLNRAKIECPDCIVKYEVDDDISEEITDSSNRHGYFIMTSDRIENIIKYIEN